ncbi:MAG: DUF255 domain-containing protein [Pirellulaceae bacterium]
MKSAQIAIGVLLAVFSGLACSGPRESTIAPDSETQTSSSVAESNHRPARTSEPNRLKNATSPYLLLHADNPIDWYPWGEEAFARAIKEDKLIFLSIGYMSCHWCHVMEQESFMDQEIADFLNEHFVCIKVDREERPDVDLVYMQSHLVYSQLQRLGNSGGWPLTLFLLPDGRPVFAGSYFPARNGDRDNLTGLLSLLNRVRQVWDGDRDSLLKDAELITSIVAKELNQVADESIAKLDPVDIAKNTLAVMRDQFDLEYGGIGFDPRPGKSPKFPRAPQLQFVLQNSEQTSNKDIDDFLALTMQRMIRGGLFDQIGGGWHRYTVDRQWEVPHFEKMLLENAELLLLCCHYYNLHPNTEIEAAIRDSITFIQRDMKSPVGGFYTAIDADSEGGEGAFYAWTASEIREALGEADFKRMEELFGLDREPNFEDNHFVLNRRLSFGEFAKSQSIDESRKQPSGGLKSVKSW